MKTSHKLDRFAGGVRNGVIILVAAVAVVVLAVAIWSKPKPAITAPAASDHASGAAASPAPGQSANLLIASESGRAAVEAVAAAKPKPDESNKDPRVAVADLINRLNNPALTPSERKQAIKELATIGSAEALAALKAALTSGSPEVRAAIAEGLAACASAECAAMLTSLLGDTSETVVQAAIRALAQQGSPQAVAALTQLLYDTSRSLNVRAEAALGLTSINQPGILDTLSQAAFNIQDEDIVTQILNGVGKRDFEETQSFFQNYLRSPNVSSEMKTTAVEALAQAKGDPTTFLTGLVSDSDSDVRVSAAWALSATEATGKSGGQLLSLLQAEQDPDVRLRIYQALRNQESYDVSSVMAIVKNEQDPSARVSGLGTLAMALYSNPTPELQAFFDQTATAELKDTALRSEDKDDRMKAVLALIRANTPGTMAALGDLAQQAADPKVKETANRIVGVLNRQ